MKRSERGSTIVEFGLIYSLFLFILIATIDIGVVLFMHESFAERVRAAARYGAPRPYNATTVAEVQNLVLFNQTSGTGDTGWFDIQRSNVTVTLTPGALGFPDRLSVRLAGYQFRFFTPLISGLKTGKPIEVTLPVETP